MNRSVTSIITIIITILLFSRCGSGATQSAPDIKLEKMKRFWHDNLSEGRMDSVINVTSHYYNSIKDTKSDASALAALQLSQAYTIMENQDSAEYYLSRVTPFADHAKDPMVRLLYHHIKGSLALKYRLDYPEALSAFHHGYCEARDSGNKMAMVTMLANIGYIYYILNDPNGMEYAQEAVAIVSENPADVLSQSQAYMSLSLMQQTNDMSREALATLGYTDSLISRYNLKQLAPLSYTAHGDVLSRLGKKREAENMYERAIDMLPYAEPSFGVLVLIRYGILKEREKDIHAADSLYRKALSLSNAYSNLEFRADILLALAKLHSRIGNKEEALSFFNRYHCLDDSLHKSRMVQDFNSMMTANLRLEKENEVQKYRIRSLRTQRVTTISVSLLSILTVVVIVMSVTHRKQRRLHEATVRRLIDNQETSGVRRPETDGACSGISPDDTLSEVFQAIDKIMKEEKAYRNSDISLDTVASAVASNRTYVSKAVNTFAGVSFSRYVNAFRISDAVAVLSDHARDVRIKELAADLGFSSDSAFSKIFKRDIGMSPSEFRKSAISIAKEG